MDRTYTRRAVAAALLGTGIGAGFLSPAAPYLDRFTPLSGEVWARSTDRATGPVDSPYGDASITYDMWGVPTIESSSETAAYFAVGYAHGVDRLFQMDLFRRRMRGTLSEVAGEATIESDRFSRRVGYTKAAEATWNQVEDTAAGASVEAYAAGVNAARTTTAQPIEFGLLGYEPSAWTPVDTMLMEKQIAWGLTGSFETLRNTVRSAVFDDEVMAELYPDHYDHDAPILRNNGEPAKQSFTRTSQSTTGRQAPPIDPNRVAALSAFEWPSGIGSNSWVLSGEYTESGDPIVANDPHLTLTAPPVWIEQRIDIPEYTVHGVTFPGVPFVVIGRNEHGAWGFTNAGADVCDFYEYDSPDADTYVYDGESREYTTRSETIDVADGPNEEIEIRETVHGPVISREGRTVAMAWTGLSATATTAAVYEYARSENVDDMLNSVQDFDEPTQNLVYADTDGGVLYCMTGKVPIRRIDGEPVPGTQIFDGSAGEGEWEGFTPYGQSTWEGFIPFDEKPQARDFEYIGTANQRITDTPQHYLAESYSDPFRGIRLYNRLDALVQNGRQITPEDMRDLQRDTVDLRAAHLIPDVLEAVSDSSLESYADPFVTWEYRMERDSVAALRFALFWDAYRRELYETEFDAVELAERHWPSDWVTATLQSDAAWFTTIDRSREEVIRAAVAVAQEQEQENRYEVYGDLNTADINHPFAVDFLGYPERPIDGSPSTLFNYHRSGPAGSSWRMIVPVSGAAHGILPGGNSGDYFDPHYRDQFSLWRNGGYRELTAADGRPDIIIEAVTDD